MKSERKHPDEKDFTKTMANEKGDSMENELKEIKAGLMAVAKGEDAPVMPFEKVLKTMPKNFPISDYSMMPPEDARTIVQALDGIREDVKKVQKMDETAKGMRADLEIQIKHDVFEKGGYEDTKTKISELRDKLITEVESTIDSMGKVLIEYDGVVFTVWDKITEGKVTDTDKLNAYIEALKKFASKEVYGKIEEAVNNAVAVVAEAKAETKKKLDVWEPAQDIRKKIKQEVPKEAAVVTADMVEKLKSVVAPIIDFFKGVIANITDAVSDLWSAMDMAAPVVDEMKALLATDDGATASKKTASDISDVKAALLD